MKHLKTFETKLYKTIKEEVYYRMSDKNTKFKKGQIVRLKSNVEKIDKYFIVADVSKKRDVGQIKPIGKIGYDLKDFFNNNPYGWVIENDIRSLTSEDKEKLKMIIQANKYNL